MTRGRAGKLEPGAAKARGTPSRVAAEWARTRGRDPAGGGEASGPAADALVLGDESATLAEALEEAGVSTVRWHRRLHPGQQCTEWPPSGPFREAWVRMPRAGMEAAMLLHAAAARVADGGAIFLFGAANEGIRSAAKHFPLGTEAPRVVLVKRRCRVLRGVRIRPPPRGDGLAAWEVRAVVDWGTGARDWTFFPGVFACGRLDAATELLARHLPKTAPGSRLLDYGAGTGVLAAAALERSGRGSTAVLLEPDAISLAAAARNVPRAEAILGRGPDAVPDRFDLIVSNPPLHEGRRRTVQALDALATGAPRLLTPGGRLFVVTQRQLPAGVAMRRRFASVRAVADHGPFRVWVAGPGLRGQP